MGLPSGACPPPLPFFLIGFFSNNFTILPNPAPHSLLDVTSLERLIQCCEHLAAGVCDQYIIRNPHAAFSRKINSRLDGHHHSRPQFFLAASLSHHWQFMNLSSDAMAEAVAELLAISGFLDHVAGHAIRL